MDRAPVRSLRAFLDLLRERGDLHEVQAEVDPRLEVAEIHRRVIAAGGPALLFRRPKGSGFPVVTNLFGTPERASLAFGERSPFGADKQVKMTFPSEPEPRIPPLFTDDLRPECLKIRGRLPGKGLQGEGFSYNLLGVLMYNPETLRPFLDYAG